MALIILLYIYYKCYINIQITVIQITLVKWLINKYEKWVGAEGSKGREESLFPFLSLYAGESKIGVFQNSEICVFWQNLPRKSCIII